MYWVGEIVGWQIGRRRFRGKWSQGRVRSVTSIRSDKKILVVGQNFQFSHFRLKNIHKDRAKKLVLPCWPLLNRVRAKNFFDPNRVIFWLHGSSEPLQLVRIFFFLKKPNFQVLYCSIKINSKGRIKNYPGRFLFSAGQKYAWVRSRPNSSIAYMVR